MKTLLAALICLALCLAMPFPSSWAGNAAQQGSDGEKVLSGNDYLIIPGRRAGIFLLGAGIDRLEHRVGKATIAPRKDFQIYSFPQYLLDLCVQRDLVVMIMIKSPRYRTEQGIAVGAAISPAIRAYGKDYEFEEINNREKDYIIQYWEKGISFTVRKEHIIRIRIFNQKMTMKHMVD